MVDALVLAGGVAKGAFGAGVLSVLLGKEGRASANLDVRRVLATSSGALNGSFAAATLHAGTEEARIDELRTVWIEEASFGRAFQPSLRGILSLSGLSSERRVLEILRRHMKPTPGVRHVELRVAVATLEGTQEEVGGRSATTFESLLSFDGATFEPEISRVFVVTPQPRVAAERPSDLRGVGLAMHLADLLTEERLVRDLSEAYATNLALLELAEVLKDPALRARVMKAIGWARRRPISIVEIRPPTALAGNAFDGFFSRELREGYVRAGEEAARAWLARGAVAAGA